MKREEAYRLRSLIEKGSASLSDEDALEGVSLFGEWKAGLHCEAKNRYTYDGILYRCEQTHDAQEGWEPPKVPALFTKVAKPGEIPVWVQPTGAQDAYNKGDKVHYPYAAGPVYVSIIDGNVWSPEAYPQGWAKE